MTLAVLWVKPLVTLKTWGRPYSAVAWRAMICRKLSVFTTSSSRSDLGDILGAKGKLFKTKTGELSIHCTELRLLTKALRPLPDTPRPAGPEARCRQRYLIHLQR